MPKKNSGKKSNSKQASPDVDQKKPNPKVKEPGTEIDEIFSGKKRKAPQQESPNVEEEKPTPAGKKLTNEIDEIFAGKKKKKPKQEQPEKGAEDVNSKLKKKKSKRDKEGGFSDPPSRSRTRTEDGLTIYTEEELGVGKSDAGGTPLCPFDCSCCF